MNELLNQERDAGDVADIPVADATGWLPQLVTGLHGVLRHGMPAAPSRAYLAHGYAHLPLPARDGCGIYLRMAYGSSMTPWPIASTSVVLTVAGTVALEVYQNAQDMQAGRPQYMRTFRPEEVFAAHPGTQCALQSSAGGVHVLAAAQPEYLAADALTFHEHVAVAQRARRVLAHLVSAGVGGAK
ncbi:hypothetical protein [Streptomyces chryseus]